MNPNEIMIRAARWSIMSRPLLFNLGFIFPEPNSIHKDSWLALPLPSSAVTEDVIATVNRYGAIAKKYAGYANTAIG